MIPFAYFGTAPISLLVLEDLVKRGFTPSLIVTYSDKPVGRKQEITENPVASFAANINLAEPIPVIKAAKLSPDVVQEIIAKCISLKIELFVVMAYGRIIPKMLLDFPKYGSLNIHPSLLPEYRGPAPLQTSILNSQIVNNTKEDSGHHAITIMLLDEEMDHGPIVAQEKVAVEIISKNGEIITYPEYEKIMAKKGAELLADILPKWVAGQIKAIPQNHTLATYTKKVTKEDGFIEWNDLMKAINNDSTAANLELAKKIALMFAAYTPWPSLYTINPKDGKRIKITALKVAENGQIILEKIISEGKPEIKVSDLPADFFQFAYQNHP